MQSVRFSALTTIGVMGALAVAGALGCSPAMTHEEEVLTFIGKAAGLFGCFVPGEDDEMDTDPTGDLVVQLPGDVPLTLVRIPRGSYMRGRYDGEQGAFGWEGPRHHVTLTQDFYLGKYVVTKRQWEALMDTTPWSGQPYVLDDPDSPAVYVGWNDVQAFINALNTHIANTNQGPPEFRLPSEAEWEYACRAGTTTRFYWGDDLDYAQSDDYAWHSENFEEPYAHKVGLKLVNPWGLYDMSGNVWEWCQDWFGDYPREAVADPTGPATGASRVVRGGAWYAPAFHSRSACRTAKLAGVTCYGTGFRLAK